MYCSCTLVRFSIVLYSVDFILVKCEATEVAVEEKITEMICEKRTKLWVSVASNSSWCNKCKVTFLICLTLSETFTQNYVCSFFYSLSFYHFQVDDFCFRILCFFWRVTMFSGTSNLSSSKRERYFPDFEGIENGRFWNPRQYFARPASGYFSKNVNKRTF